jgi:DNA repair protein RecO (recombination protein O)
VSHIENATGIILRTRLLSDTSLIVQWLTPNLGRISTVAKGARRPQSPFRGKLDLFYLADFSFARSRRSELHTLREVSIRDTRKAIRQNLQLLQQASYLAALVEQVTETETPLENVFNLAGEFFATTTSEKAHPQVTFAFELKLLHELGLAPDLEECNLSPGAKEIARHFLASDLGLATRIQLSRAQSKELSQFLHGFLIFHLGKIPRSRTAAVQPSDRPD